MPVPDAIPVWMKKSDKARMNKLRRAETETDWEVLRQAITALEKQREATG